MAKQAVLFLSDKSSQYILDRFSLLAEVDNDKYDVFYLYHNKNNNIPTEIQKVKNFCFTSDILHTLGYTPIRNGLLPGSNHFPLLNFFLEHDEYNYYWLIEDDVVFTGKWNFLFDIFRDCNADFLSSYVYKFIDTPYWCWWYSLKINGKNIVNDIKLRSFNPIYRISDKALYVVHKALQSGWQGHHEVLIPTILNLMDYKIVDFGGNGSFVPTGFEDKFYNEKTLSFIPLVLGNKPNTIYHPIKEKYLGTFSKCP